MGSAGKKILMIAFHYPPCKESSGIQRSLKFSSYLRSFGWDPVILSAHPRAYIATSGDQDKEIPNAVVVRRAFALDTSRHLAMRGSYLKMMALPDRWITWWPGATISGMRLIRRHRPDIIWSTYPIATAHLIGLTLHRLSGIPWVADFRDSMTEDDYPKDPATRKVYRWIERRTVRHCAAAVFTTPGAVRLYAGRYPEVPESKWALIPNGFDEENFQNAESLPGGGPPASGSRPQDPIVLLHSGLLYPWERDPRAFFAALQELKGGGKIHAGGLKVILRASGSEELYRKIIGESALEDIVFLEPAIPYGKALVEMLQADGLLIFQAANCNHQIPAKIYEYLRARRPILALTDPAGDTAGVLKAAGIESIVRLDSREEIAAGLVAFLGDIRAGKARIAGDEEIARHSRFRRTEELARLLERIAAPPARR